MCFREGLGSVLGDLGHIKVVSTFKMSLGKERFVGCPLAFLPTKQAASHSLGKAAPKSDCKEKAQKNEVRIQVFGVEIWVGRPEFDILGVEIWVG